MRRVAAVALVFAVVAAACSGDESPVSTTTTTPVATAVTTVNPTTVTTVAAPEAKPYGGSLGTRAYPTSSINPWFQQHVYFGTISGMFEPRVWYPTPDREVAPGIVEVVPTIDNGGVVANSDGSLTVMYRIIDEAVWSDGTPISGTDFAFTYETIMRFFDELGTPGFADIDPQSLAVAPKSFGFTLIRPFPEPGRLFQRILPAHVIDGTDFRTDWTDRLWVSGGPFVFDELTTDGGLHFVRNPNYWRVDPSTGQRLPFLDEVQFVQAPAGLDSKGAFDAWFATSPISVQGDRFDPDSTAVFYGSLGWETDVDFSGGGGFSHLAFQFGEGRLGKNRDSLVEHRLFREAVALGIDVGELAARKSVEPLYSPVRLASPSLSDEPWRDYRYDPDRATELIRTLCASLFRDCGAEPPQLHISYLAGDVDRERTAQIIADMLARVGIEVVLDRDPAFFEETLVAGEWEAAIFSWNVGIGIPGLVDLFELFDPDAPSPAGNNVYRWGSDPTNAQAVRYTELLVELHETAQPDAIPPIVLEAERILADALVIVPFHTQGVVTAWDPAELGGVVPHGTSEDIFWNVGEWYRVDLGAKAREAP